MNNNVQGDDGFPAESVGAWAIDEKHYLLRQYVELTWGARRKYLGTSGATLIDLYCGWGRVQHRDTGAFYPGGCVAAFDASLRSGSAFSSVIINDVDSNRVDVAEVRLNKIGATVLKTAQTAAEAAGWAIRQVDGRGLHLAYLDPYDLNVLPFTVLEALSQLKRVDMMIHVSTQDLQRNFGRYRDAVDSPLDRFAPGWRSRLARSADRSLRPAVLAHWLGLLGKLGFRHAKSVRHVRSSHGQTLYHLYLLSRNKLAEKLWNASERSRPQIDLL